MVNSTTENVLKVICQHVAANYKDIVGVDIDQIEFQQNMDADFYNDSLVKIVDWIEKKYPGYDVTSNKINEKFLNILDEELFKRMYRNWAYIN
jgi:hypothetical protein